MKVNYSDGFEEIKTSDPNVLSVLDMARRAARSNSSVLISGESGTGKELIARGIHNVSPRSKGPFVAVNCGAIPRELLESELMGYERGAFTGAVNSKVGDFESAHNGTIFLDEVSTLPLHLQAKLLRTLQEREIKRLGSVKTIKLDIRVVAATNDNLNELVESGTFRQDLYFRLNVIPIHLPPLRERKGDIPILLEHFLDKACAKLKKTRPRYSKEIVSVLQGWAWPGNVREFENLIERVIVLSDDSMDITVKDIPLDLLFREKRGYREFQRDEDSLHERCKVYEKGEIIKALHGSKWNRKRAARLLRIHRNTLSQKMRKLGIPFDSTKGNDDNSGP
ncbi:MAG: sigma 54-interacting transcriptional regulator [Nitrospirae bacterium]|nr:sigma 54-interacting transcriptional regulator [Nitrospirota bacterium]